MNDSQAAWIGSLVISSLGVLIFGGYLVSHALQRRLKQVDRTGHRPWRVLGAAICLLLSVMFFVGVNYLDARRDLSVFLLFWMVMLLLTGWACALALLDLLHTRRQYLAGVRSGNRGEGYQKHEEDLSDS